MINRIYRYFPDSCSLGTVIREIKQTFSRFQVFPDTPDRLVVASYTGHIYDVNIRDGSCRLICDCHEQQPKLTITNDGQRVVYVEMDFDWII